MTEKELELQKMIDYIDIALRNIDKNYKLSAIGTLIDLKNLLIEKMIKMEV